MSIRGVPAFLVYEPQYKEVRGRSRVTASIMVVGLRYTLDFALHTSQECMFDEGMGFLIPIGCFR